MAELTDIRQTVRERYASVAKAAATGAYDQARAGIRSRLLRLRVLLLQSGRSDGRVRFRAL